ncbi:MAG: DUF1622 domain-containing protein [Methanomassiliicoccus sp.]|nr:DUF1622 domain-containing protein [Methanomassiliicoccus sp.]
MDVSEILDLIAMFLAYSGVLIIAYGGVVALAQTVIRGVRKGKGQTFTRIRGEFAKKIIFGLDFLIASDIVSTINAPNIDEVIRLGGIVLIRTVLTFVLSKEEAELRAEEREMLMSPGIPDDHHLHSNP